MEATPNESELLKFLAVVNPNSIKLDKIIPIARKEGMDVNFFVQKVLWHKIRPQVFSNICHIEQTVGLKLDFFDKVKKLLICNKPEVADKELSISLFLENVSMLTKYQPKLIFLKGSMLQMLYYRHTYSYRQMNDIDVLCPNFFSFFDLLQYLESIGYDCPDEIQLEGHPLVVPREIIFKESKHYLDFISAHCIPRLYPQDRKLKRIDLKCGNYFYLPINVIDRNKEFVDFNGVRFLTTSINDEIKILIMHALDHTQARWGWLNDLYVMSKYGAVDMERLVNELESMGLASLFYAWIDILTELYDDNSIMPKRNCAGNSSLINLSKVHRDWVGVTLQHNASPIDIFRIRYNIVKSSSRHKLVVWIVSIVLFLEMLPKYIPSSILSLYSRGRVIMDSLKVLLKWPVPITATYSVRKIVWGVRDEGHSLKFSGSFKEGVIFSYRNLLFEKSNTLK